MQAGKFAFLGREGQALAGQLDLPAAAPKSVAIMAHCFTCSKDLLASREIARGLTALGFAVLRFDFTGLGRSQGNFADTNFSSNVEDLFCAAEALERQGLTPELLIGHSLGGAAVISAAPKISTVRALVTIGAPFSPDHVRHQFADSLDQIEREGAAEVQLAGRPFTVKKQFLDDIATHRLDDSLQQFRGALLVMHAPLDETVGIANAGNIFAAAHHPKSFISLDQADHLLTRKADAHYVTQVISAWSSRYILPVG